MVVSKKRTLLTAVLSLGVGLAFATNARAGDAPCDGRESWLVPGACTYCEWGGSCGDCKIVGCKPPVQQVT